MKPGMFSLCIFFLTILTAGLTAQTGDKTTSAGSRSRIDLSGTWHFQLDPGNTGIKEKWFIKNLSDSVTLPGTTDLNKKGYLNKDTTTLHLNRIYKYEGAAWYQKEITVDKEWQDKHVRLVLERTKPSKLWIDSNFIGESILLESPQEYEVSGFLSPGRHTITIRVDNTLSLTPYGNVHIYSDDTQTNWNGITGKLYLEASGKTYIKHASVFTDIKNKKIKIVLDVNNHKKDKEINILLNVKMFADNRVNELPSAQYKLQCDSAVEFEYSLDSNMMLWDEYAQPLYKANAEIINEEEKIYDNTEVTFGMREFRPLGKQFSINDRITFLRGKHDAGVFPLTGHVPMDTTEWMRVFRIAKSYGINHYRFHSYCPPEAAFEAADRIGIYIQAELPFWGGLESDTTAENLLSEGISLLKAYGNHPSFVMFSPGNEIWSGHEKVSKIVTTLKSYEKRVLYTQGSNNNIGYTPPAAYEDFHVAARTPFAYDTILAHVRLTHAFVDSKDGGILNTVYPSTKYNFDYPVSAVNIPLISHETGQYQIYPDYNEISKYTGVLKPLNLEIFKNRLKKTGMSALDKDFHKASGALSALCYRAEIETALRTKELAGFQLLDLQDYPGQGTALVGILDAFMESKNVIPVKEWRQFCNDVVLLLEFEKYCWTTSEVFRGKIEIANYSSSGLNEDIVWELTDNNGKVITGNFIKGNIPAGGVYDAGEITVPFKEYTAPAKYQVKLYIRNTSYLNCYDIWLYPPVSELNSEKSILVTDKLNPAIMSKLNKGAKVLLFPRAEDVKSNSVAGMFNPDFWNYGMFRGISEWAKKPVSPGTLGLLINTEHPVFKLFPTDYYTNWQWWPIIKNSNSLVINAVPDDYLPIVQVIDNLERNNKMALLFEFKVGKGKLLICMSDLRKISDRPEALQLYRSIINYMKSEDFRPEYEAGKQLLNQILK